MKKQFPILFLFLLSSCLLFEKYDFQQLHAYDNSLTESERRKLKLGEQIFKQWYGTNGLGDFETGTLLVVKWREKTYKFIQVGIWENLRKLPGRFGSTSTLKQHIDFDSLGNVRSRETYMKLKGEKDFHLVEKLTTEIDGNSLFQKAEMINMDGTKMYTITHKCSNYLTLNNYWYKQREFVKIDNHRNEEIKLIKDYDLRGDVMPRLRMKK